MRQSLAHVSARVKGEFQQSDVLNGLGLHALNPGDVKKVIFVVVDQVAFHLCRTHSAIRLCDVDHRQIKPGKNVDGHPRYRQNRAKRDSDDSHEDRNRSPQGSMNQPHGYGPPGVVLRRSWIKG